MNLKLVSSSHFVGILDVFFLKLYGLFLFLSCFLILAYFFIFFIFIYLFICILFYFILFWRVGFEVAP